MRTSILISVLLGSSVLACASNPNKKLEEAQVAEAEAARERRVGQIEGAKDKQLDQIETRSDQIGKRAETMLPEGADQRAKAQAEMTAVRQSFQTKAQARLQKAEARLIEVRRKMQIAGGRVPTNLEDQVALVERERSSVAVDIGHLPMVPNERWDEETKRVDKRIGELESAVDDATSRVNDLR